MKITRKPVQASEDFIIHRGDKYDKFYDHEEGGTYFVHKNSSDAWLDVYPDGEVKALENGRTYHVGRLDPDTREVVKGSDNSIEIPWWNDLYDDISIAELSHISDMTPEEIQAQIDEIRGSWPGFRFDTFAVWNGPEDGPDGEGLYSIVAIYTDPNGDQFLAQMDGDRLTDVTPDIEEYFEFTE